MKTKQTQKLLKLLNANPCCDCPPLSNDEGNIIECREDGLYAAADGTGGEPLLFAVAGQDDTAAENRSFDITGFDFEISSGLGNTLLGVYEGANSKQIFAQVTSPLGDNGYVWIDMNNQNGAGANSYIDLYAENGNGLISEIEISADGIYGYVSPGSGVLIEAGDDSNSGTYLQMNPNSASSSGTIYFQAANQAALNPSGVYIDMFSNTATSSYIDIYAWGNNSDDTEIYIEAGQIYMFLDTNADLILDGIDQDDTATQVLVRDVNDAVRWRDASTIGGVAGAASVFIDYDIVNVPDDASNVTAFSIALEANATYAIEMFVRMTHSSGVGYNLSVGTTNASSMNSLYEFVSPASGGEIDTTLIKREFVTMGGTFNLPNTSFHSPTGTPFLKLSGWVVNGVLANDIFLNAALDAAGPQSGGVEGWMKLTKIE